VGHGREIQGLLGNWISSFLGSRTRCWLGYLCVGVIGLKKRRVNKYRSDNPAEAV
jgi:hypothetical protein